MKKLLILFCGGTIVMVQNAEGANAPTAKDEAIKMLLNLEPRVKEFAEYDIEYIDNIDSTNIEPKYWDTMTKIIAEKYDDYDGFVITHGTDTMAYSASALSFSIQNLGKPIVFTGAQIRGGEIETDAKRNFVNAVRLATYDIAGVYLVFAERILRGVRATKAYDSKLDAYASRHGQDAGEILVEMVFYEDLPKKHSVRPFFTLGFERDIGVFTINPSSTPEMLEFCITHQKIKGLIIMGYGPGNIPYSFDYLLDLCREKKIPVVLGTQCLHGTTTLSYYDVGLEALKKGAIEAHDMSLEAITTKLMWALKHYPYEHITGIMKQNFVGEMGIKTFPKKSVHLGRN